MPNTLTPEMLAELREMLERATPLLDASEARTSVPHTTHHARRVVGFKILDRPKHSLTEPLDQLEALEKITRTLPALLSEIEACRERAGKMEAALALAVPILQTERDLMVDSNTNLSGPNIGEVTDADAKAIIDDMQAALNAAIAALTGDTP